MSRIPQSTRAPPTTPAKSRIATAATPSRVRTQSTRSGTPTKPAARAASPAQEPATPSLSIKEAIALRRAEAKKAQLKSSGGTQNDFISLEDASPFPAAKQEDEDILGRWPVRESIERARSTGICHIQIKVSG